MIVSLSHNQWQILRTVLRAEADGGPPTGRDLRLIPSRLTKHGTFLDELVALGLLARAGKPTPAPPPAHDSVAAEPEPFRVRYRLTAKGRDAAEYGEYDLPLPGATAPPPEPPKEKAGRSRAPAKKRGKGPS